MSSNTDNSQNSPTGPTNTPTSESEVPSRSFVISYTITPFGPWSSTTTGDNREQTINVETPNNDNHTTDVRPRIIYFTPPVINITGPVDDIAYFWGSPISVEKQNKNASKRAIESLKHLNLDEIPESNRNCSICLDCLKPSPIEKNVTVETDDMDIDTDKEHITTSAMDDPPISIPEALETDGIDKELGEDKNKDHSPLQMPCGHYFGDCCIKEWLKESSTCPMCRKPIESEMEFLKSSQKETNNNNPNHTNNDNAENNNTSEATSTPQNIYANYDPFLFYTLPNIAQFFNSLSRSEPLNQHQSNDQEHSENQNQEHLEQRVDHEPSTTTPNPEQSQSEHNEQPQNISTNDQNSSSDAQEISIETSHNSDIIQDPSISVPEESEQVRQQSSSHSGGPSRRDYSLRNNRSHPYSRSNQDDNSNEPTEDSLD